MKKLLIYLLFFISPAVLFAQNEKNIFLNPDDVFVLPAAACTLGEFEVLKVVYAPSIKGF